MKKSGYIKAHRSLLDWEWWYDDNTFKLFMYCLFRANFEDTRWKGIDVKKGSFITSYKTISKETGLSIKKIRVSINKLKRTGEVAHQTTSQYSILTVNNWDRWQAEGQTKGQSRGNQRATDKNAKNDKEDKNIDFTAIKSWWNDLPYNLTNIQIMSDKRKSSLKLRVEELGGDAEVFKNEIEKAIENSSLLQGNKLDWKADFDFILQKKSFIKMIEGSYSDKQSITNDIMEGNF